MTDSAQPPIERLNNAATRTALTVAQQLTHKEGPRIPNLLPENEFALRLTIIDLEHVAADGAELAMQHQPGVPLRDRAYAFMVFTRTAVDIIDATTRWVNIACEDSGPAHVAAYAALLGVLTRQLITAGRPPSWLRDTARTCAVSVAADIARDRNTPYAAATLKARMDAADAATRPWDD